MANWTESKFFRSLTTPELGLIRYLVARLEITKFYDETLVLAVGGMVSGIHNKPPGEQDIDIAIDFSSPDNSQQRYSDVQVAESTFKRIFRQQQLIYTQHTGLLAKTQLRDGNNHVGWMMSDLQYNGESHQVVALIDHLPHLRFTTQSSESKRLKSFDIVVAGLNYPAIEQKLMILQNTNSQYEVLLDTRD